MKHHLKKRKLNSYGQTTQTSKESSGQKKKTKEKTPFRLNAMNLFLTYPQCNLTKEYALEYLKTQHQPQWIVVSHENHEPTDDDPNGGHHLHVAMKLPSKKQTYDPHYYDIHDFHGNYQSARDMVKVLTYVIKHGDFCQDGINAEEWLLARKRKKSSKLTIVADMIKNGSSLTDVDNKYPEVVLQHMKAVRSYIAFQFINKANENKQEWKPLQYGVGTPLDHSALINWLNKNLFNKRKFKQKQLWLWSKESNLGKTSLWFLFLQNFCKIYLIPYEDFYDLWQNETYDLAIIDEYSGEKKISWLNIFLEGSAMPLKIKNGQTIKMGNIPTIIIANDPPTGVYSNAQPHRVANLEARLEVIELTSYFDPEAYLPQETPVSSPEAEALSDSDIDMSLD